MGGSLVKKNGGFFARTAVRLGSHNPTMMAPGQAGPKVHGHGHALGKLCVPATLSTKGAMGRVPWRPPDGCRWPMRGHSSQVQHRKDGSHIKEHTWVRDGPGQASSEQTNPVDGGASCSTISHRLAICMESQEPMGCAGPSAEHPHKNPKRQNI